MSTPHAGLLYARRALAEGRFTDLAGALARNIWHSPNFYDPTKERAHKYDLLASDEHKAFEKKDNPWIVFLGVNVNLMADNPLHGVNCCYYPYHKGSSRWGPAIHAGLVYTLHYYKYNTPEWAMRMDGFLREGLTAAGQEWTHGNRRQLAEAVECAMRDHNEVFISPALEAALVESASKRIEKKYGTRHLARRRFYGDNGKEAGLLSLGLDGKPTRENTGVETEAMTPNDYKKYRKSLGAD